MDVKQCNLIVRFTVHGIVGSVVECEEGVQRQKKRQRSTSGMAGKS
jgi:hypothetical protein